jgi:hypothetical protein
MLVAGVYIVWDGDRLIYRGMSGREFEKAVAAAPPIDLSASQYSLGKSMVLSVNQNVMPSRGKSVNGIFLM